MLYTVSLALCVLLSVIGMAAVCYFIFLLFMKPQRNYKSYIVLPLGDDEYENASRIGYAYERLNLFGEDVNAEIIAIEKDEKQENIRKMFSRYNNIKFAQIGDMPDIMSHFWDT